MARPVIVGFVAMALADEIDPGAVARVARALGAHTDLPTRALYATDASIYTLTPAAVFYPRHEADLVRAVEVCGAEGVPMRARGGGTSLSGQALTSGLIVDMTRFAGVRIEGERAHVGPGLVIDALDRAGAAHGLRWGPAPASANRATIGGLLANNGTGARSVVFGMASDHLHAARILLADGRIREFRRGDLDPASALDHAVLAAAEPVFDSTHWPRTWRNASGLDLRGIRSRQSLLPLFCGSEGGLGILLEAEVGLVPRPARSVLAVFAYPDLVAAMRAVPALLALEPSAVELMDHHIIALARKSAHFRLRLISGEPAAVLMVEFEAADAGGKAQRRLAEQVAAARSLGATLVLEDPRDQAEIWNTRKEGLGLLMSSRGCRRPLAFIEDGAVPVEALPEYVTRLDAIIRRHGTEGAWYAHASAGCLHVRPLIDLRDPADRGRMDAILDETARLLSDLGGTLSGEHGDGYSKTPHLETVFGREIVEAFAGVRRAFDPSGLFRVPPKASLRVDRPRRSWPGVLLREDGTAGAVERCNGEGACRKAGGVMCPSFQASGDEALSTRGRANLLAAWFATGSGSGSSSGSGDADGDLEAAIDRSLAACLACKACSFECPSSVDMAGLKAEWAARRGPRWSDRFFASYPSLSRIGRVMRRLTGLDEAPIPSAIRGLLGLAPNARFALPEVEGFLARWRHSAASWGQDATLSPDDADALLFVDTHLEFYEPEIGEAFCRLAAAAGKRIVPVRPGCCGRPAFSRGMLDEARAGLEGWRVPGAAPLVVVEPSCLSMIRDDAPRLLPAFSSVASRAIGVEEWLLRQGGSIAFRPGAPVLLHAHCHQKAMHDDEAVRRLLERAGSVRVLDAGCCGMAGSFGYDAGTASLALAVAEDRFLPGLRSARRGAATGPSDGAVAAETALEKETETTEEIALTGRSCREMAARDAQPGRHPLVILADRIESAAPARCPRG